MLRASGRENPKDYSRYTHRIDSTTHINIWKCITKGASPNYFEKSNIIVTLWGGEGCCA